MKVSFIIIAYNAQSKLNNIFNDLIKQDYPLNKIEIILVDSNSSDDTKKTLLEFKANNEDLFERILVLDNPKKILPCGWNIALKHSSNELILRVDAHSSIPENFFSANVEAQESGEYITGGLRTSIIDENNAWQQTLLIAETSLFGSGIAKYRRQSSKGYVSTLAHACYRRSLFEEVGGYDERLARTEDNEMHYRMKEAGYKFLLDPAIHSYHHVRSSAKAMIKQKYLNGYWIGLTLGISPKCFSLYHFIPLVFVLALIATTLFTLVSALPLMLLLGTYLTFIILNTVLSILGKPFKIQFLMLPFLFISLHLAYGLGTIVGIIKIPAYLKSVKGYEKVVISHETIN